MECNLSERERELEEKTMVHFAYLTVRINSVCAKKNLLYWHAVYVHVTQFITLQIGH